MKKLFVIVVIWGVLLGGGAAAYYYLFQNKLDDAKVADAGDKDKTPPADKDKTPPPADKDKNPADKDKNPSHAGSAKLRLALDSFSGYCIFRSDEFAKKLADQGVDFEYIDDNADYTARMKTVQSGDTPLAVFTIDALINNTPPPGDDPPATIIMVIDETRGADAMIGLDPGMKDVDALNRDNAKIVLVQGSPSETLARVVRSQFNLPKLPILKKDYLIPAKDDKIEDVYQQFLNAQPSEPKAFVLWEPYVSKALERPGARVLVDSSQFKGYIVDVLVAQQKWLHDHPAEARVVVQSYLEALHDRQQKPDGMAELVRSDSVDKVHEKMTADEAAKVAKGVWWKNTLENYAHFGILASDQSKGLPRLDEMIRNITVVLDQTKQPAEPSPGVARPDNLYDDSVLRQLYAQRPAFQIGQETIRDEAVAARLTDEQWGQLRKVGTFKSDPVEFKRNGSDFSEFDDVQTKLGKVAENMRQWPQYYLRLEGNTRGEDTPENQKLAKDRADTVKDYLVNKLGVEEYRIHTVGNKAGQGTSVEFVMLQR